MEGFMKGNGRMANGVEKGKLLTQMVIFMKGCTKKTNDMDKVCINGITEENIKVVLSTIKDVVMEYITGQIIQNMRGNFKMDYVMEKENIYFTTEAYT
mmetsp:Transcript_44458/g.51267  ORF Transcript_44458/g.51267 Transcript_44458/m.51267 type:complete len:98 (+) Transcript_44458:360-653(+)